MDKNVTNRQTYKLVFVALMIALTLIVNRVFPSTPVYHLTVDFIPVYIVAVLFGPFWSALTYAVADTIGGILFPVGPYNPGITLTLLMIGLILGLIFGGRRSMAPSALWIRSFAAAAATLVIKLFCTTYFLYLTYGGPDGMGYFAYVISRIPNCVVFAALVLILIPPVQKIIVERVASHLQ